MSSRPPSGLERLWRREETRPPAQAGAEPRAHRGERHRDRGRRGPRRRLDEARRRTSRLHDDVPLPLRDEQGRPPPPHARHVLAAGERPGHPDGRLAGGPRAVDPRAARDHADASLARRGAVHRARRHAEPDRLDRARPADADGCAPDRVRQGGAPAALSAATCRTRRGSAATASTGAQEGAFESPDQATEAFGELLRTILDPEHFPALIRAVQGGAFAPTEDPTYLPFDLGLEIMLDGVEQRIARATRKEPA